MAYLEEKQDRIKKACEDIDLSYFQKKCNELANIAGDERKRTQITEYEKAQIVKKSLESKGVYEGYSHCTLKNFIANEKIDAEVLDCLYKLKNDTSSTILFLGETGNGKTHLAIASVINIQNSFYTNSKKMLIDYRSVFQGDNGSERQKLDKYISFNLLVIDEIDRISATQAERDFLFLIIEERQARKKATILISNKTILELGEWIADSALMRRLTDTAKIFKFKKKAYTK